MNKKINTDVSGFEVKKLKYKKPKTVVHDSRTVRNKLAWGRYKARRLANLIHGSKQKMVNRLCEELEKEK